MKIRNGDLPLRLQGTNRDDYMHDLEQYRNSDFKMQLKAGYSLHVSTWISRVISWKGEMLKMDLGSGWLRQCEIKEVNHFNEYTNNPKKHPTVTKVTFMDGTVEIVKLGPNEVHDREKAVLFAIMKHLMGSGTYKLLDQAAERTDFTRSEKRRLKAEEKLLKAEAHKRQREHYLSQVAHEARRRIAREKFEERVKEAVAEVKTNG